LLYVCFVNQAPRLKRDVTLRSQRTNYIMYNFNFKIYQQFKKCLTNHKSVPEAKIQSSPNSRRSSPTFRLWPPILTSLLAHLYVIPGRLDVCVPDSLVSNDSVSRAFQDFLIGTFVSFSWLIKSMSLSGFWGPPKVTSKPKKHLCSWRDPYRIVKPWCSDSLILRIPFVRRGNSRQSYIQCSKLTKPYSFNYLLPLNI